MVLILLAEGDILPEQLVAVVNTHREGRECLAIWRPWIDPAELSNKQDK